MSNRSRVETYPNYAQYLDQARVWPSDSSNNLVIIECMPHRYAISAYDKLHRWARGTSAQIALNVYNLDERERYVHNSQLAKALLARAQGEPAVVDSPRATPSVAEVTPRDIMLLFAPIVAEHTDLNITQIFTLCEALATRADEEWIITKEGSS